MTVKDQIENKLKSIIGMPLWSIGNAASLEWFCFGSNQREITSRLGKTKTVSDYALHIQCAWAIIKEGQVYAASGDRYFQAGDDPYLDYDNFDWDTPAGNRLNNKITLLDEQIDKNPLIVLSVQADEVGGLNISFSEGYSLKVLPQTSFGEYWRLFTPYSRKKHFVVTWKGIEYD